MHLKIGKSFHLIPKIDEGSTASIYKSVNTKTGEEVAIKVEQSTQSSSLIYECKLYAHLHKDSNATSKGIPKIYYGSTADNTNVMVIELLGKCLDSLFELSLRKFSLKTVLMIIDQMITSVQFLHSKHFIHRGLKPCQFCIGLDKKSHKIFIVDFGRAKRFIQKDGNHIPYRENKSFNGNGRFASINTLFGIEPSCRDDMESIGYIAIYFLRGKLPWQGLKSNNNRKESSKEIKLKTSIEELCEGCPQEFAKYMNYVRNLAFDEKPQYSQMREMFKKLFIQRGFQYDYEYDWVKKQKNKM